ncbi:YbjN domain-containing protein [Paenirhodobacter sp.]|uniref:YbjN domain-containing protein n=1 Tax=Paenirhodobacter sp. TaxID=1965326 RepID=UPI003B3EA158
MALSEDYLHSGDLHPIDMVEMMAVAQQWDFDRITEDQIAMTVTGQWRTYSITLAWSARDETLRLISTFDMEPPQGRLPQLLDLLNRINDQVWAGAFTWWNDHKLMVWRHGLILAGGQVPGEDQIDRLIGAAVSSSEQFYPAMQLTCWGGETPERAMQVAIAEAYGRA